MKILKSLPLAMGLSFFALSTTAQANDKPISEAPWLRDYLPEKITAYARIPNPMFFFAKADTPLKPLYDNENYVQSVNQIKNKLITNINDITSLSTEEKQAFNLLLSHLRAPVEVMVEQFTTLETPPAVLIATTLDYQTAEAFVADFKTLLIDSPFDIQIGENGKGKIISSDAPINAQFEYQSTTGKLLITIADKPTELANIINQPPNKSPSPIADKEAQIDASGQGLFATVKVHPMMFMAVPREHAQLLNKLGVMSIKEISAGLGIANQRPKLKVMVDMPQTGIRQLLPAYPMTTSAQYYGELNTLFSISLPNADIIDNAVKTFGESEDLEEFKQKFNQESGFEFDELLTVFGRSFTFITDDSGNYAITDKTFNSEISQLIDHLNHKGIPVSLTEENLNGSKIKHLNLLPLYAYLEKKSEEKDKQEAFMNLRWIMQNHYYWVVEDDAVILSTLPQPLWERKHLKPSGTLQSALDKHNIINPSPFVSAVMNVRNLSQASYYQQLNLLNSLGDVADVPVNIAQYPAANALSFKRYGAIALSIDNSGDQLSVEYSLENSVSDLFAVWQQSGQLGAVAAVGILAAIALPAYQDYTIRAKMTSGIATIEPLKLDIATALQSGKSLEEITNDEFMDSIETTSQNLGEEQFIEVDEGNIYLSLDANGDRMLILSPEVDEAGTVNWSCDSYGIQDSQLPLVCK